MRQIHDRVPVGRRGKFHLQGIVLRDAVNCRDQQIARITFLAVTAHISQDERRPVRGWQRSGGPHHLVKTLQAAVQCVRDVIRRQSVFHAVERKFSLGDAVAVTSDQRAEIWRAFQIAFQIVVAQHHVAELAMFVRHLERRDNAAVSHDRRLHAVAVAEGVEFDRRAVRQLPERGFSYGSLG